MTPYELIIKKREGLELDRSELEFIVNGFTDGSIPDYQMSAFLMAGFLRGFSADETANLTSVYMNSGTLIDLSSLPGHKLDKHSTGGVGDTVSLMLAPLVATYGITVPMISGRGLGHTGGTLDKLESIPGFRTDLSIPEFISQLERIGVAIIGQTAELVPADGKIYALRDVTGTVDTQPLIVASIMSKKLAEGINGLVLDVKVGSGAFMQDMESATSLAKALVDVGESNNCTTRAYITNMDQPLGRYVGNALEMIETIKFLRGDHRDPDMLKLTLTLGAEMLLIADAANDFGSAYRTLEELLENGRAYEKLQQMVEAQGGNVLYCINHTLLEEAPFVIPVKAKEEGFIARIATRALGIAAVELGAGRKSIQDKIKHEVGFEILKKLGDPVKPGDEIVLVHAASEAEGLKAVEDVQACYTIQEKPFEPPAIIQRYVDKEGVREWPL
ncbi:thymidine phosphorylase [bacterium]|nr:thymidine phosphorylase [bacterium]